MANEFDYNITTGPEGDFLGQYGSELGQFIEQAPGILSQSSATQRQALAGSQRTGLASLAEGAAQARAAAMGGAGQMAGGGGRAASLRQGGLSFGKRAADFAAEGAMRAAGLEKDLVTQQLQMKGEMIPGALLAQSEAAMAPQDELLNLMNTVGMVEENFYWDADRAKELLAIVPTLAPGSPAYRYAYNKLHGYYSSDFTPTTQAQQETLRAMESQLGAA